MALGARLTLHLVSHIGVAQRHAVVTKLIKKRPVFEHKLFCWVSGPLISGRRDFAHWLQVPIQMTYSDCEPAKPADCVYKDAALSNAISNLQSVLTFCADWEIFTPRFYAKIATSLTPCSGYELNDTS